MFCMMQINVKVFSIRGHLVKISVKVLKDISLSNVKYHLQ